MSDLKPCPFCGCNEVTDSGKIECDLCLSTAPHGAQWNQRVVEDRLSAELAEVNGLFDEVSDWADNNIWGNDEDFNKGKFVPDHIHASKEETMLLVDILAKRKGGE